MIILRALLLWSLVSIHVIGGACLFRRFLPKESPWFGFILPSLALPVALNFIEHGVALTALYWLLPFSLIGSVWMAVSPALNWRFLWKPTVVFLLAFTIPFAARCIRPDIGSMRDGPLDVFLMTNFCMGDRLPPDSTWMPGFRITSYYDFQHYAASVLTRLFNLDPGTGFNVSASLLQGLILFTVGAIGWRLGRNRLWVAIVVVLMTATATTGIDGYLWFFQPNFHDADDATMLLNQADVNNPAHVPFEKFVHRYQDYWSIHELIPLGYWIWTGGMHSVMGGQFLTLLSVMSVIEMTRRRRSDVPWIGAVGSGFLLLVTSTWGVPLAAACFAAGAVWCWRNDLAPRNWRAVVIALAALGACLTPLLDYFLKVRTPGTGMGPDGPTQAWEFVFQWWPFYVPWLLSLLWWRKVNPGARVVMVIAPLFLLGMEFYNIGARIDMTGKLWADLSGVIWAVTVPILWGARSWFLRGVACLMFIACGVSACFWVGFVQRTMNPADVCQLSGQGDLRTDPDKGRIFNAVSSVEGKIIVVGRSTWNYSSNPLLATLTKNKAYIAWCFHCACAFNPESFDEASVRDKDINAIYAGKKDDAEEFLHDHHIEMMVIWPDDHIPDDLLAKLKRDLAPQYLYKDCRQMNPAPDEPNSGVFISQHMPEPFIAPRMEVGSLR
jgi:hypothetical protein